jgi:hypothetical protein
VAPWGNVKMLISQKFKISVFIITFEVQKVQKCLTAFFGFLMKNLTEYFFKLLVYTRLDRLQLCLETAAHAFSFSCMTSLIPIESYRTFQIVYINFKLDSLIFLHIRCMESLQSLTELKTQTR